jgi:endonuclease/exonuclease/phosphatase family metal-dependent hydrolase/tetratricopeptide (TPR) repeat protein
VRDADLFKNLEHRRRAYETTTKAMELEREGQVAAAEEAYRQGVEACRKYEPDGLDFALGRFAAFLIGQSRDRDAQAVLEEAIALRTEIPAVWGDYERLLLRQKDLELLCSTLAVRPASVSGDASPAGRTLAFARRAFNDGDAESAWALAERALQTAAQARDNPGRWATLGFMGVMHEKADTLDQAVDIWTKAVDEGSADAVTVDRLSLALQRRKDFAGAVRLIDLAMERGLPAHVEERLRQRRERCASKSSGQKPASKSAATKAADVPAYSERRGTGAFSCVFQKRVKPAATDLDIAGGTARCFGKSKGMGTIVDLDLTSGEETNRAEGLPAFSYLSMSPSGWGIGVQRTAAVGQSETKLTFLEPAGTVYAAAAVPDGTSEVARGLNMWFVGCRDGGLYAFDLGGVLRWRWETPGSCEHTGDPYSRPCPYHVDADAEMVVAASMGNLYALRYDGRLQWSAELPTAAPQEHSVWLVLGALSGTDDAYRTLGLKEGASDEEVRSAYRRAARDTHPDLHPGDPDAAQRFRAAHSAYEMLVAGDTGAKGGSDIEFRFSISFGSLEATATFVRVRRTSTVVGSSNGRVHVYDAQGHLAETHLLGQHVAAPAALHDDGSLAAVWNDGMLFSFSSGQPTSSIEMERPDGMVPLGEDVVVWCNNNLKVVDRSGTTVWDVDFARRLAAVAVADGDLVCAAGAVMRFQRAWPSSDRPNDHTCERRHAQQGSQPVVAASTLSALTWNINLLTGTGSTLEPLRRLPLLPDVVTLQEVARERFPEIGERLHDMGYPGVIYSGRPDATEKLYGNVIAARTALAPGMPAPPGFPWPQLVEHAVLDAQGEPLHVITVHVPNGSNNGWKKIETLDALKQMVLGIEDEPLILTGDFNEPRYAMQDGHVVTWGQEKEEGRWTVWEGEWPDKHGDKNEWGTWDSTVRWFFEPPNECGLRNAYWASHGHGAMEASHLSHGTQCWYDHIFVSRHFTVRSCEFLHPWQEEGPSDHSPLAASLSLPSTGST